MSAHIATFYNEHLQCNMKALFREYLCLCVKRISTILPKVATKSRRGLGKEAAVALRITHVFNLKGRLLLKATLFQQLRGYTILQKKR